MYITIAGGGLIGRGLSKTLIDNKHDVIIIDSSASVCEEIYARLGAVTINGNATSLETLENARIEQSDVAVAVMRDDSDNLNFALLAKHFKVPQIVVRMHNPKYEDIYKSIGVSNIARATDMLIDQMLVNIESPDLRKVTGFGNLEICIINIGRKSFIGGRSIKEINALKDFPQDIIIAAVFQDETKAFIIPRSSTVVKALDRLFVCGTHENIKKASRFLS